MPGMTRVLIAVNIDGIARLTPHRHFHFVCMLWLNVQRQIIYPKPFVLSPLKFQEKLMLSRQTKPQRRTIIPEDEAEF